MGDLILGVDPGKKGALAVLDNATLRVTTTDMPSSIPELLAFVASLPEIRICILEKAIYPKMIGTSNAGKIGEGFGALKAAILTRGIPVHEVAPAKWKPALNVPAEKTAARRRASEFFPSDYDQWPLVKHDGRAEAAMIAWYGRKFA